MFNKLLQRQVQKHFNGIIPDNLHSFLKVVGESYEHYEKDRKMLEHSIEISSAELVELNQKLRKESEDTRQAAYQAIRESLYLLKDGQGELQNIPEEITFLSLVEKLKAETKRRKEAELKYEQWKTHLEASQKIAHVGSWELEIGENNDMQVVYWSDELFEILGYTRDQVALHNDLFFKRVHPEDLDNLLATFYKAIESESVVEIEHRFVMSDNTEKPVYERARIIRDSTGRAIRVVGTTQDITERKITRTKLVKAHNELRTLFNNMQEVFYSVDMENHQLLQISQTCETVYGYTMKEFAKNPNLWLDVILEEDKPIIYSNKDAMYAGRSFSHEYRIHRKDGSVRWLESRLTPTLDASGKLMRLDGTTADVTKRKEAEMALRDSERKFRFLIEHSADVVMVVDENSKPSYVSDSLYRITGYTAEDVMSRSSLEFIHRDDWPLLHAHLKRVAENPGKPFTITYRRINKDGSMMWCEGTAINLLHEPAVNGIVVNFRNVTERKNSEDALKASNEWLKKSNTELDRFVYSASHDLRAPLTSMLGIIQLAETEPDPQYIHENLEMLKSSIAKLDNFIADILNYSRNSRLDVKREKIDFRELITDVTDNLRYMNAGDTHFYIYVDESTEFFTDRSRLYIILNNLISNALRYNDPEKEDPFVNIMVQPEGEHIRISVKDNGIGIRKDMHERIFEMFFRLSQRSVGSGLGLYIVKETMEKLHGSIQLESAPGEGSEFTLLIPNLIYN